jgi:drug/metabolite transporter (DMT)-like permease
MNPMAARNYWIGILCCLAGAALFSTKAIFIKLAYQDEVNASLLLAYRMLFSLPFFVAAGLWAWSNKMKRGEALPGWRTFWGAVATGCIGYYLSSYTDFKGLEYISAQLERLLLFTYPLYVMLFGAIWWKHRITGNAIIAALITYAGLAVVFGLDLPEGGRATVIGSALVILCAMLFAIYQLLAKQFVTVMGSVLFTAVALASSGIACVLHQAVVSGGDFAASSRFLWLAAGCAIFATVFSDQRQSGADQPAGGGDDFRHLAVGDNRVGRLHPRRTVHTGPCLRLGHGACRGGLLHMVRHAGEAAGGCHGR